MEKAKVISQEKIAQGIYSLWLKSNVAKDAKAGMFASLYCNDASKLLPRPISICEVDKENNALRFVYRVVGNGTKEFSELKAGDELKIIGPLGNGYTLKNESAMLLAGGIGIPPMVELAKELKEMGVKDITIVAGYRDELFLTKELETYGNLYISTEDGSAGSKGNVMNAISDNNLSAKVLYACGPKPMLKAIKDYAIKENVEAQISLEERMACGIGACLGCVCKTKGVDSHSHVNNARVCTDGPVFEAREVEL